MAVDPDVQTLLDAVASTPISWDDDTDVEAARAGWQLLLTAGAGRPDVAESHDRVVDGPGGDLALRVYRPEEAHGLLAWFHGGGFVLGSLESHDGLLRGLSHRARCTVVAVDYRLGPEHPFPAAQEDAIAAYRWIAGHRDELGRGRIGVGGDSAGGSLAAHVAIDMRDAPSAPAALVMVCPVTDLTDGASSGTASTSMRECAEGYLLSAATMAWFSDRFAPDVAERRDPRVSVLRAPDLARVAPTLVITAEHDPLRDQGEAFAARLDEAGVDVTASRYEGTVHAFFGLVDLLESGRRSLDEAAGFVRARLAG